MYFVSQKCHLLPLVVHLPFTISSIHLPDSILCTRSALIAVAMRTVSVCCAITMAVQCIATSQPDSQSCDMTKYTAQDVISKLNLIPNDEKGYFGQTFQDETIVEGNRSASTAIYYFLEGSDGDSRWHRVFDVEVWHYYAGAPLDLSLSWNNGSKTEVKTLGPDIFHDQSPQIVVKKEQWQSARSLGSWTLVGTTGTSPSHCSVYFESF